MSKDKFTEGQRPNQTAWFLVALGLISIMAATTVKATQAADAPSAAPTELVTYGPYVLPGEFSDIQVMFKTDIGVIACEFQDYRRDDSQLLAALRLGSGAMEVVKQTGWGHIVPYAYAATYHFLGRLFYGLSTSTPLLPKTRKTNVSFTLLLISDTELFRQRAAASGHGVGVGYWDSQRREAGIHINKAVFSGVGYQSGWKGRSPAAEIQAFERSITRMIIREIGHEIFHAIQTFTDSRLYRFPLMVEATALLAQYNTFEREEGVIFGAHQMQINTLPDRDRESLEGCSANMGFSDVLAGDFFSMLKIQQAYEAIKHKEGFSLTSLLLLDEVGFYGVPSTELADRYNIALSVIGFLHGLEAETQKDWEAVLQEAHDRDVIEDSREAATRIDAAYLMWMEQLATRRWKSNDARKQYQDALKHQLQCLKGAALSSSRLWAIAAGGDMPKSPTPALYLGDLFFKVNEPYTALDYYKIVVSLGDPVMFGEYLSRIQSRIGEALEQLGDIQGALSQYESMLSKKPESPWVIITFAQTQLKYEYYRLTEASGRWHTEEHREALNRYMNSLWTGEAIKVIQEQESRRDANGYVTTVVTRYKIVLDQMRRDLGD